MIDLPTLVNWFVFYVLLPFIAATGGYWLQRKRDERKYRHEFELARNQMKLDLERQYLIPPRLKELDDLNEWFNLGFQLMRKSQKEAESQLIEWQSQYSRFMVIANQLEPVNASSVNVSGSPSTLQESLPGILTEFCAIVSNTVQKGIRNTTDNTNAIRAHEVLFPKALERIKQLKEKTITGAK